MFKPMKKRKPTDGRRDGKKDGKKGPMRKKFFKRKPCKFCLEKAESVNYLDYQKFQKYITERGKMVPSRISGNCAKHQRQLARAIRRARIAALLPFVAE